MGTRNPSKITTDLAVDDPLVQTSEFDFGADDRQKIDNQILGVEKHLVACVIKGAGATYVRLSGASASVAAGDVVCLAALVNATEVTATKCTAAALALAGAGYGVVLLAAAPGSFVLVATSGAVAPSATGLAASSPGPVRIKPSTGRCERVAALAPNDYAIGFVDNAGWLTIGRQTADAIRVALLADFASTTSTSAQDTNLLVNVGAADVGLLEIGGIWNVASGTSGAKLTISGPAGAAIEGGAHGELLTGLDTYHSARINALGTLSTAFNTASNITEPVWGAFRVKMGGTAGILRLQVAPVAAVVLTLKAGFWMRWSPITEV